MMSAAGWKNPVTSGSARPPPLPSSWWITPVGRKVVGGAGLFTSCAYFGGYTLLHSFFLDRYQSIVQLYKHGFPTPLTPDVIVRCKETLQDVNIEGKGAHAFRFFCVFGMDMFHAGSTKMIGGSLIGVPRCFTYATQDDIERHDIVVENNPIEWGSEGGQLLKESLVMSERAQKFAIAREIAMTDTYAPYIFGGTLPTCLSIYIGVTKYINEKVNGFLRPKSFRVCCYSLVGTFMFGVWATVHDNITKYYERYADERAGGLGLEYAKGGVEFYSKILERNMGLRALMSNGEKKYTYYGNDVETIRQRHIPFTERKKRLEEIAAQLVHTTSEQDSAA